MSDIPTGPVLCSRCGKERTPGGLFCPHCGQRTDGVEETLPLRREEPKPPQRIADKFEVVREIGRGGFGIVYEARDTLLDRPVAIKTFREESYASAEGRDAFEKRFLREARHVARLSHPNIVTLHDAFEEGDLEATMASFDPDAHVAFPDDLWGSQDIRERFKTIFSDPSTTFRKMSVLGSTLAVQGRQAHVDVTVHVGSDSAEKTITLSSEGGIWRIATIEPSDAATRIGRELDALLADLVTACAGDDPPKIAQLFARDATIVHARDRSETTDVLAFYRLTLQAHGHALGVTPTATAKTLANVVSVSLEGSSVAEADVMQSIRDGATLTVARYQVRFVKEAAGWRVARLVERGETTTESGFGRPEEDEIVRALNPHFARKDAAVASEDFEATGVVVQKDGTRLVGREQVRAYLAREFSRGQSDWSMGATFAAITNTGNLVVFDYEPNVLVDGKKIPRLFRVTAVKGPEQWLVREMREIE